MTSSTAPELTGHLNGLPEDIFSYSHEKFYDFVKKTYGTDLSELLSFQAIRNGAHLLSASPDDILSIFQQESEDINELKKLCCFLVAGNKCQVKLGVKLAINNLIQSLKMKQEQQKKKKRYPGERPSLNLGTTTLIDQTRTQNETSSRPSTLLVSLSDDTLSPPSTLLVPLSDDTSSSGSRMPPTQQKLNELGHKNDVEERINKWWKTINGDNNSSLDEGTHYFLEINKSINDTYACILICQCHIRFKLPFTISGYFKLSSFCRHLKEKQCVKLSKTKHGKENNVDSGRNSSENRSMASNRSSQSSSAVSKKNKTATHTGEKRLRSPSPQGSSNTSSTSVKKNRPLSKNTTNAS